MHMRSKARPGRRLVAWLAVLVGAPGCFDPGGDLRGKPCTADASCGELSCEYGVCGGPRRCEAGAGVGDFCFSLTEGAYEVGAGPSALAIGLVDADPRPDLVVANADAGTLSLLLNDGAGAYGAAIESAALGDVVRELVIGQVDGAGLADVVATTEGAALLVIPLSLDEGGGPLFAAPTVAASALVSPTRPRVGDFVDDPLGTPDVAVLVEEGLDVRRQDDALAFASDELLTAVAGASDIRLLGQGMERAYIAAPDDVAVWSCSRNPNGTFSPRKTIDVGAPPERLVLEDFDLDDYADLLTVSDEGQLWLTRGKDVGLDEWHMPAQVYDVGWAPTQLAAANLDDDPALELVVAGGPEGARRDLYLFDNDGDGKPIYGGSLGVEDAAAVVLVDLEPDGVPELVLIDAATGRIRIARRTVAPPPPGGEEGSTSTGGTGPGSGEVETGDPTFETGDPSLPEVTSDPTLETGVPGCMDGFEVAGLCYSAFGYYVVPSGTATRLTIGDVNHDAFEDLVVADGYGDVYLYPSIQSPPPTQFEDLGVPMWSLPGPANGLTVRPLDAVESYNWLVATHGSGVSARAIEPMTGTPSSPVDVEVATPCFDPIVATFYPGDTGNQVAFHTNGAVGFIEGMLQGGTALVPELASGATDIALFPHFEFGYAAIAATPGGIVPYSYTPGQITGHEVIGGLGTRNTIGVGDWLEFAASSDGASLDVTYPDYESGGFVTYHLADGANIGDFAFGDFNADYFDDIIVVVAPGSGNEELHLWIQQPADPPWFDGPHVVPVPNLADVAVRRSWGSDQGAQPPEVLIALTDGTILQFGGEYVVQ